MQELLNKIDEITPQMIEGIKKIVRIRSVQEEPLENQPFGAGVDAALEATLELANSLGFEIENVDHRMGIAKYQSHLSNEYIGILGHLDVVPEGEGWKYPPYSAHEENGRIYGRGVLDNKGPILSCLYALYAIKELKLDIKYPIWILFGTNEETGFEDLKHYLTKKHPPIMGWTPDCKYPVVYAERGRCVYQIKATKQTESIYREFINQYIKNCNEHADLLGLDIQDPEFGMMQMRNVSIDKKEEYCTEFTLSYPASIQNTEIFETIQNLVPKELEMKCVSNYNPVFFEKDCFLCRTLKETYEEVMKEDGTPVTTTGGTYAKMMPNIVPFGPSFPGQKGIAHLPNEWMDIEDIVKNAKIYALSMLKLARGE